MSSGNNDDQTCAPADMMNDQSDDATDVLNLFNNTIRSLANDAMAIRQMTDLAEIVSAEQLQRPPQNNDNGSQSESFQSLTAQLVEVEDIISTMEEKVEEIKCIINEEKDAIAEFESSLRQKVEEQEHLISLLEEEMVHRTNQSTTAESSPPNHHRLPVLMKNQKTKTVASSSLLSSNRSNGRSRIDTPTTAGLHSQRHHPSNTISEFEEGGDGEKPQDGDPETTYFTFQRISVSEMTDHKRNSPFGMSRISRMDLNEALEEIEVFARKKVQIGSSTHKQLQNNNILHNRAAYVTSHSLQRRFDYLQQRKQASGATVSPRATESTHNRATVHDDHRDVSIVVSEQELRENCAFFRHGESTARATLSVLCSLKRLKQTIPGSTAAATSLSKNQNRSNRSHNIAYSCLFGKP